MGRLATLSCALAALSCTGISSEVFSLDASAAQHGYTQCGTARCPPGSYCVDSATGDCSTGCLSGENCAVDQECARGGDAGVAPGLCETPAAEGASCTRQGACPGGALYCYFRSGIPTGACRRPCSTPPDCFGSLQGGLCCQVGYQAAVSVCVPVAQNPMDGTCQ